MQLEVSRKYDINISIYETNDIKNILFRKKNQTQILAFGLLYLPKNEQKT